MPTPSPRTYEMVDLLRDMAPAHLDDLRRRHPHHGAMLSVTETAGGQPATEQSDASLIDVQLELSKAALETVSAETNKLIPSIRRRLRNLKTTQLVSQILVALGGASIVATLGENDPTIDLIAGAVATVGSLLTIYTQSRSTGLGAGSSSLSELYTQLTEYRIQADKQLRELALLRRFPADFDEATKEELIDQTDELAGKLHRAMATV